MKLDILLTISTTLILIPLKNSVNPEPSDVSSEPKSIFSGEVAGNAFSAADSVKAAIKIKIAHYTQAFYNYEKRGHFLLHKRLLD